MREKTTKVRREDDPERCQNVFQDTQCFNRIVPGTIYCEKCGGLIAKHHQAKKDLKNYQLRKFKERIFDLGASPNLISLRDEIAIMRMMVEERINSCSDVQDLLTYSGPIADKIMKVKDLVTQCHKLETSLEQLMDREQLISFTNDIVNIISDEVTDADQIMKITNRIMLSMEKIKANAENNLG